MILPIYHFRKMGYLFQITTHSCRQISKNNWWTSRKSPKHQWNKIRTYSAGSKLLVSWNTATELTLKNKITWNSQSLINSNLHQSKLKLSVSPILRNLTILNQNINKTLRPKTKLKIKLSNLRTRLMNFHQSFWPRREPPKTTKKFVKCNSI